MSKEVDKGILMRNDIDSWVGYIFTILIITALALLISLYFVPIYRAILRFEPSNFTLLHFSHLFKEDKRILGFNYYR